MKHESEIPRVQYWRFFFTMAFTVEHVKNLLQVDLVTKLEKVNINLITKIKQFPNLSQSKLNEHLTVLKTFVETCWWNVIYQMILVGRPLHWGKIIILYFMNCKMNRPQKKTTMSKNTIFKGKLLSLQCDSSSAV